MIGAFITMISTFAAGTFFLKNSTPSIPKATPPVPPVSQTWANVVQLGIYAGLAFLGWNVIKTVHKWVK